MRRTVTSITGAAALAATLTLSACGSNVPPNQFYFEAAGGNGAAQTSGAVGQPTGGVTTGPNSVPTGTATLGGGGGGGGAGGGGGGGGGSSSGGGGTGAGSPTSGVTPGSCAGFKNSTGISNSQITLTNASDVSGPVPGLFASAQQATNAFAAYFNNSATICGRKFKINNLDSQTSDIGDQQAATTACSGSLAMVGSVSAFDTGGAKTVANCGIPDLRAVSVNPARVASAVSFGTDSINPTQIAGVTWNSVKNMTGNAYKKAAVLYLNAGAAAANGGFDKKMMQALGFDVVDFIAIDVTAFNYTSFVSKMINDHVTFVQFVGAYQYGIRLKKAIDDQHFKPVFMMDSVAYDDGFVVQGGSNVNGTWSFSNTALFEEVSRNPEMQLYVTWLHRLYPSARPSFFGMYAWGSMRLFAKLATQLGGQLTRTSMLSAIRGVHSYTSNGLFTAQDVGAKKTPPCSTVIQLVDGKWVRKTAYPFVCGPVINAG